MGLSHVTQGVLALGGGGTLSCFEFPTGAPGERAVEERPPPDVVLDWAFLEAEGISTLSESSPQQSYPISPSKFLQARIL